MPIMPASEMMSQKFRRLLRWPVVTIVLEAVLLKAKALLLHSKRALVVLVMREREIIMRKHDSDNNDDHDMISFLSK